MRAFSNEPCESRYEPPARKKQSSCDSVANAKQCSPFYVLMLDHAGETTREAGTRGWRL